MKMANHNPKSSVFVTQFSHTNVSLNFRGQPSDEFASYAGAYHRAGQALFEKHFTPETRHDLDVLPIGFLYRHAAELYLKAIVRRGNTMLSLKGKDTVTVRRTHKLTLLINDVRPIFEFMTWSWDAECEGFRSFEDFRKCLADLEQDDVLGTDDSQADMWRYPVRKKDDAPHLPVHFNFDVREFVKRLDVLLGMLGGAAIGLDMELDAMSDALAHATEYHEEEHHDEYHEDHSYDEPPDYE